MQMLSDLSCMLHWSSSKAVILINRNKIINLNAFHVLVEYPFWYIPVFVCRKEKKKILLSWLKWPGQNRADSKSPINGKRGNTELRLFERPAEIQVMLPSHSYQSVLEFLSRRCHRILFGVQWVEGNCLCIKAVLILFWNLQVPFCCPCSASALLALLWA